VSSSLVTIGQLFRSHTCSKERKINSFVSKIVPSKSKSTVFILLLLLFLLFLLLLLLLLLLLFVIPYAPVLLPSSPSCGGSDAAFALAGGEAAAVSSVFGALALAASLGLPAAISAAGIF